jgi:DNA-binding transcriptional LysR family regulator
MHSRITSSATNRAMNWDDARLFLAVARAGQMLGAARRLGLNQATLSRRIAALEAGLGTQLLVRRTHGCSLTEAGAALARTLERVESQMLQAQSDLARADAAVTGTVRIGAPDGFGLAFFSRQLGALADAHPGLTLQLVPIPHSFSLSEREADIAVMVGRPVSGRLIVRKLTDYTVGLYAARGYLARAGTPASLAELAERHRLVGYVEDLIYAPGLNYASEIARGWRSTLEISSAIGQVEAVRAGAGIGVLHDYLARPDPALVPVLPASYVTRSYWIAWHESHRDIARVQVVARFLAEIVREHREAFLPQR